MVVVLTAAFVYLARDDYTSEGMSAAARTAQKEDDASIPGGASGSESGATLIENQGGPRWVSTDERVARREALPCTGEKEPINFAVFSAGPAVAGAPMTATIRRCDAGALADESTSNYFAYVYGDCRAGEGGCRLPLQIRRGAGETPPRRVSLNLRSAVSAWARP